MENDEKKCADCSGENADCESCKAKENTAEPDDNTHAAEPDDDTKGLDYLTKLCYAVIDRADITVTEKRNLLMAIYSFRCLFDAKELHRVSKVLVKYGCSFVSRDKSLKDVEHVYEVTDGDNTFYKFDVGSPVWQKKYRSGEITGESAVLPDKPTLYETVNSIVSLDSATDELRALWLVYFPYVFMIGAPVDCLSVSTTLTKSSQDCSNTSFNSPSIILNS